MKVIFEPIITEKATNDSELRNRYTFVVNREANKIQIKDAVEDKYNVTVEKVRTQIYGSERKTKFTKRGVQRTKTNIKKKAIVDIQDGDSIDFYNNL
tara:strand:+ start:136 stop:426 length:291 start_codon:yes stop_codon:yes gene_type:complete